MDTNLIRFPRSNTERLRRWDATATDLGECVHDDCHNPAIFHLTHLVGSDPSMKFTTGSHAQKMKRFTEQENDGYLAEHMRIQFRAPVVCGDCALGALAAFIAYGNGS